MCCAQALMSCCECPVSLGDQQSADRRARGLLRNQGLEVAPKDSRQSLQGRRRGWLGCWSEGSPLTGRTWTDRHSLPMAAEGWEALGSLVHLYKPLPPLGL